MEEKWTICKDGKSLITFTSMLDMSVQKNTDIPTEAIESGSFAAYNRTQNPKEYSVTLAITGDDAELHKAQDTLDKLASGTVTFDLVTPDYEHNNCVLVSYDYSRERSCGRGFLVVSLSIREIREVKTGVATLTMENVKNPSCAGKQKTGRTQTRPVDEKTQQSIENGSGHIQQSMMSAGIDWLRR